MRELSQKTTLPTNYILISDSKNIVFIDSSFNVLQTLYLNNKKYQRKFYELNKSCSKVKIN